MADNSLESNAQRLAAWNAWKEVCWVHGLGKPRGELPIVGTADDERLLAKTIRNAFLRKLSPFKKQLADSDGNISLLADIDCAQEFDNALVEYEHVDRRDKRFLDDGQVHLRKKKSWKDDVWRAIAASKDHPIKVISGKLLGPDGIINDIVEDWLSATFSVRFNGKFLEFHRSRDAMEYERKDDNGSDDGNFLEHTAGKAIAPDSYDEPAEKCDATDAEDKQGTICVDVPEWTLNKWRDELKKAFPVGLCCLMMANFKGVKLYADTEILEALGISKTTAANNLNKATECLSKLDPELRDWIMCDAEGTSFFKHWIEKRCQTEKAGRLILSRIEGKVHKTE